MGLFMAFTSTDLSNIEAAIVALATGTREVSVSINGKRIDYAECDIDKLTSLKTIISQSLGATKIRAYARNIKRFER